MGSSGADFSGRFSGRFSADFGRQRFLVSAEEQSGTQLTLMIDGKRDRMAVQFSTPNAVGGNSRQQFCFLYDNLAEQTEVVEKRTPFLHFLGSRFVRDDTIECLGYAINVPTSGATLEVCVGVHDGEVVNVRYRPDGEDQNLVAGGAATVAGGQEPGVSYDTVLWHHDAATAFRFPDSCVRSFDDLEALLPWKPLGQGSSIGVVRDLLGSLGGQEPPLFLLGLPLEWPRLVGHFRNACGRGLRMWSVGIMLRRLYRRVEKE